MTNSTGTWLQSLETRTQRARLLAAGADTVYGMLRQYSQERVRWRYSTADEALERSLFARCEPLVDIALASFAASEKIVAQLWQRSCGDHYKDPEMVKGIRLACLSNHTVLTRKFPTAIVGAEDIVRILAAADREEAKALISNDRIEDALLIALYERQEPFAALDEDLWRGLVTQSSHNPRLNGEQEGEFGPELSQDDIHRAIFRLLGAAPVSGPWVVALHYLLESLGPQQEYEPEPGALATVLQRWSAIEVLDKDGAVQSGVYPGLTYADELRCLIGALYGHCRKDGQPLVYGAPAAASLAERCAYYGNGQLSVSEVEKYIQREPFVFAIGACANDGLMARPELRGLLEEAASGRDFKDRYLRILRQYQTRWPHREYAPIAAWLKEENAEPALKAPVPATAESVADLERKLAGVNKGIERIEKSVRLTIVFIAALTAVILVHLMR